MLRPKSCVYWIAWIGLLLGDAACVQPAKNADYDARIGVAVKLPDRVCMAMRNSKLLPSASITLLAPSDIPSTARAQVLTRNADPCPGSKADTELNNYNLQITSGSVAQNLPLVALDARVPSVYAAHSFHSCTSADGVHLTAWDGAKPLEGHRLWHHYYYMGQDLEANCTRAETGQ